MVLEQIYFTKLQAPDLKHPRNSKPRSVGDNVLPSAHVRRTPHHQAGMHSCDAASASSTFACIRRYLHHFARCQTISGTRARNTLHSLDQYNGHWVDAEPYPREQGWHAYIMRIPDGSCVPWIRRGQRLRPVSDCMSFGVTCPCEALSCEALLLLSSSRTAHVVDQSAIGVDMDSSKQAASSQLGSRLLLPSRTVVQKHYMA